MVQKKNHKKMFHQIILHYDENKNWKQKKRFTATSNGEETNYGLPRIIILELQFLLMIHNL
jgi:hypothetical protein